jgi:hypothetical protein
MSRTLTTLPYDKFRMLFIGELYALHPRLSDTIGYMRFHDFVWTIPLAEAWQTIRDIQRHSLDLATPLTQDQWVDSVKPYLVTGLTACIASYNDPANHVQALPYNPGVWEWTSADLTEGQIDLVAGYVALQLALRFMAERDAL